MTTQIAFLRNTTAKTDQENLLKSQRAPQFMKTLIPGHFSGRTSDTKVIHKYHGNCSFKSKPHIERKPSTLCCSQPLEF